MRARDYFGLIAGTGFLLFHSPVDGAEWRFTPILGVGEAYTDNVALAPSGAEQDDFITQIIPGFSLQGTGGRLKLRANYRMQNLLYANQSHWDRTFHQLFGAASAELLKNHLFFDLRTMVFQALISPTGAVPPFGRGFGGGGFGGGGFGGGGFGGGGFGGGGFGGGGFGGGGFGGGGFGGGGFGGGGFGGGGFGGGGFGGGGFGGGGFGGGGFGGGGLGGGGLGGGGLGGGGLGGGMGGACRSGLGGGLGGGMGGGLGGGGFGGAGNIFATNNIATVVTLQASPSYCWRWGNSASGQVRYSHQEVLLAPEGMSRTSADMVRGSIQSGPRFNRLRWAFFTYQRYLHREDHPVQFANYLFRLQLRLFHKMSAFGIIGYENNTFRRRVGNGDTSGIMWNAGLAYAPSRRTYIEGGVGQRFFGTTAFARATYGTKRNRFGATYSQQFVTYDQLLFGQSNFNGNEGPVIVLPVITEETFLSTRTMLFWSHQMTKKTQLLVRGFQIKRRFQESDQESRLKGGSAFWVWRLSHRTNAIVGGMWARRSFPVSLGISRTDDLWNASFGVMHRFNPKLNLSLRYIHGVRDSTNIEDEFGLNMVTAMVFMRF